MYSLLLLSVILLCLVPGSFQQSQSFYFFMEQTLMEAPLVSNSNTVYPHVEIYDETLYLLAYTIMPSQTSGSVVAFLRSNDLSGSEDTMYIFTYDLSTGTSKYGEVLGLPGPYLPELSDMIVANPSSREIITVLTNNIHYSANLTFINPVTGTYRYTPLASSGKYYEASSILLDISAQVVYVVMDEFEGYYPVVLQTYDAKSGNYLTSANIPSSYGQRLLYLLLDPQSGILYGIEGSNENTTFIVTIDIQKQTTHLVVQLPANFWAQNWAYEPSTSSFYTIFAGQVVIVTLDGVIKPFTLIPADSNDCSKGIWAFGTSTQQQLNQNQNQQVGVQAEMVYLSTVPYTDAILLNFSIQALSHDISGSSMPSSVNVLTPVQPIVGYAATRTISCFPASANFFIEQASTSFGQFINLVSYSTHEVIQQFKVSNTRASGYDYIMAWNSLTNRTILSNIDPPSNVTWQMAFYEIGQSTNSVPQVTLTLSTIRPAVWTFDSLSQTIFGMQNTYTTSMLFAIQYPSGNISWKLDLSAYSVWEINTYGIVLDSEDQKLYIIICDNSSKVDCLIGDGGSFSLVEITYAQNSAAIDSITPIGNYSTNLVNFITSFHSVPSQGGVIWSTMDQLFFFDTRTKQYTNIAPFGPGCAACMFVHDI